ncbi:MAG: hypothetical protein K2M59_01415 [Muribaculaceae bacterium]|nr:hypothetical protein [Muribaculaceae bacterium]
MKIQQTIVYLSVVLLAGLVSLRTKAEEKFFTVSYSLEDIRIETVEGMNPYDSSAETSITIEGFETATEHGQHQLPVKYVTVKLPTYSSNVSVDFRDYGHETDLYFENPVITHFVRTTNGDILNNTSGSKEFPIADYEYSGEPKVEIVSEYYLNGYEHYVTIAVTPIGLWDPYSGSLYNDLQCVLSFEEGSADESRFSPIVTEYAQNFHTEVADVLDYSGESVHTRTADTGLEEVAQHYVILVPESLKNGVTRLRDWKRQKGYNVTVQTVEDILTDPYFAIGSSAECFDKESSVREWMRSFYADNGFFHCLIVGDWKTSAPIRKFRKIEFRVDSFPSAASPNYLPSDIYYTDLVREWSFTLDPTGIYSAQIGERGSSFSPTISVGRLICWTESQIEEYTRKLILYEFHPGKGDTGYLGKGFQTGNYDLQYWCKSNNIFSTSPAFDVTSLYERYMLKPEDRNPSPVDVQNHINKSGLSSIQCHGSPIDFKMCEGDSAIMEKHQCMFLAAKANYRNLEPWRYRLTPWNGLDLLTNYEKPGVLYSIACTIVPFDSVFFPNEPFLQQDWNIGSVYTVGGSYGGVCVLGNTREGWLSGSDKIEYQFGKLLGSNKSVGIIENLSKVYSRYGFDKTGCVHHVIGDPEFTIWNGIPRKEETTINYDGNRLYINGRGLSKGIYGLCMGNYYQRTEYETSSQEFDVPIFDIIRENPNVDIGCVSVWEEGTLPTIHLVTSGKPIKYNQQRFVFKDLSFGKTDYPWEKPYLKVSSGSDISLFSYGKVHSSDGIEVTANGILSIESEDTINIIGSKVRDSGTLILKGKEIEISGSFEAAEGTVFEIQSL